MSSRFVFHIRSPEIVLFVGEWESLFWFLGDFALSIPLSPDSILSPFLCVDVDSTSIAVIENCDYINMAIRFLFATLGVCLFPNLNQPHC